MASPQPVGIDLGTTYSLVASLTPTGARLHQSEMGARSTPSVVLIGDSGVVVGDEAKRSAFLRPDRTFAFFKREMGVPDSDRTVNGRAWSPQQLSAEVLKSLIGDVARETGQPPTQAVITVPAYFGDAARHATVEAGQLAGLEVLELVHEPTAAAVAFGFGGRDVASRTLLVYDLGGGTFDVSLVRIGADEMSVIATDGDHALGGKDWDDVLIEIVAERFNERHGIDPTWDPVAAADLRERCENAKRTLSRTLETTVNVATDGVSDRIRVTREEFDAMAAPLLARTEALLGQAVADAGYHWDQIDATLLIGGSTRMPTCARLIERLTGAAPTRGIDPDTAVVNGAAMVAALHGSTGGRSRTGTPNPPASHAGADPGSSALTRMPKLRDVTAHALGFVVINAAGDRYVNEVMIARNSAIPTSQSKTKRLGKGVTDLDVYVLQGHQERPLATESLGRFTFQGVPGEHKDRDVQIAFQYDGNAIVRVSATVRGEELPAPRHEPEDRDLSWTDQDPRDHARSTLDVALVIDCSASMAGARLAEAQDACCDFAGLLGDLNGARVALVSFASGAKVEAPLTEDGRSVQAAARRLGVYGSTDLTAGLNAAEAVFDRNDGRRVIVVATDGAPNDSAAATTAARRCHADGIEIVTIGVTGADMVFLASIATAGKDSLFTDDMRGAMRSIARSLAGELARKA